ncbi:hypothetical protein FEM48_Zijuj12G0108600 [Ziziphus jujuba var. spinosa]|uniref:Glycosyltransferase n=1 Tax=Ziziphus jujuba var. spinosa TaxID=714518 RepID=A0A978UCW4_ZIZJJ|nr:hypothetical protein FEM48_Zijuj12G0108600 [Ziziphus jujuba var. spinosa]
MKALHITMFPWFAAGHMTAFLHLANELAERGHRTSILLPKKAQLQLQHLVQHPHLITIHVVTVPHVDGLPPGTETASEITLAQNASLAIVLVPSRNVPTDRPITEEELRELPSGYPSSTIVLRGSEVRSLMFVSAPFGEGINFYQRTTTGMKNCDAISIRTCREIEGNLCDYLASQYKKPVLLAGPALTESADTSILEEKWAKWLGGFEQSSVVYCAFGSQLILEKDQFQELVLGFELTGLPFFLALKTPNACTNIEEALPEGFEERVKGRGVVFGGWVQQPLFLSHESVGCFVSHCGFGSMWESLMSDKQIVLVPHLGDQILNTRLLVEDLKVAVEVKREENRWFSKESLSEAIKSVMDKDSKVGLMVKKNHTMWRQVLTKPGFMSGYIDKFVDDLKELVNQK